MFHESGLITKTHEYDHDPTGLERRARIICSSGDFHEMVSELKTKVPLYESQKLRLIEIYGKRLERASFLSNYDWDMLVVLELYDPGTFEHALRVFETVHEKVTSQRNIGMFLRRHLDQERVQKEDLYRAALFHDIGKTTIPKEVLLDTTTDEEWMMYAKNIFEPRDLEEVERIFAEHPTLRGKDLVPFSCAVTPDIAESLRDRGINPDKPLGIIVGRHAVISGNVLRSYGFPVSAEIAESHHNRPLDEEIRPVSISSFRAGWILRAADLFDAVRHPRSYKSGNTLEKVLGVLQAESDRGFIDKKLADLWISDELKNLQDDPLH